MSPLHPPVSRRLGVLAVHSIDLFVLTVPDLSVAEHFYSNFGLNVKRVEGRLDLYTFGHPHCWGSIYEAPGKKKLQYFRYGIFAEDAAAFREKVFGAGLMAEPHPLGTKEGIWLKDPDGLLTQIVVAQKVSPSAKTVPTVFSPPAPGRGASPSRRKVSQVRPRHLSHILRFTPDVPRMMQFSENILGLRLSDRAEDIIAFTHTPHGSDHHLMAFVKSDMRGLHHTSWDIGSIHEVGLGAEQMRIAGYKQGWGLGRHVLGSNFYHYVRDPWGSYNEYSCDIDFVPSDLDWPAANNDPEDSLYVWGPEMPSEFIINYESA